MSPRTARTGLFVIAALAAIGCGYAVYLREILGAYLAATITFGALWLAEILGNGPIRPSREREEEETGSDLPAPIAAEHARDAARDLSGR